MVDLPPLAKEPDETPVKVIRLDKLPKPGDLWSAGGKTFVLREPKRIKPGEDLAWLNPPTDSIPKRGGA